MQGKGFKMSQNLFTVDDSKPTIKDDVIVINAADANSWIGNGGYRDATVEGFLVAGFGPNREAFLNTSYFLNPFFNANITFQEFENE